MKRRITVKQGITVMMLVASCVTPQAQAFTQSFSAEAVQTAPGMQTTRMKLYVSSNEAVRMEVRCYDKDGDDLTYLWYHSDDMVDLRAIGSGRQLVYYEDLQPGTHYFLCEVSDGKDAVLSRWVVVSVEENGTPKHVPSNSLLVLVLVASFAGVAWLLGRHSKAY